MPRYALLCLTTLMAGTLGSSVTAQDTVSAAFGARENVQQISLSPDGNRIGIVSTLGDRGNALRIVDLAAGSDPKVVLSASGDPERIGDCHWSTDARIVCRIGTSVRDADGTIAYSRAVAIDADGKDMKVLSARTNDRSLDVMQDGGSIIDWTGSGDPGSVLATRQFVPQNTLDTRISSSAKGLGVERIDTRTLSRRVIEPAKPNAVTYVSDGMGTVRIMGLQPRSAEGYADRLINFYYRKKSSRDWQELGTLTMNGRSFTGLNPVAVDPKTDQVYGFDDKDGRRALYRVALDGSMKRELVVERPDVDVDDVVTIGRQGRVVGASYATEKRNVVYFDPALETIAASLRKALPNAPLISFEDASADENKLVLFAGSDTDPGRYYLFDRGTKRLGALVPVRPQLEGTALASVKPVTYRAQDGTAIPAYLTLPVGSSGKGLPAIVMPHGGPGARDEWGFDWLAQYFAAKGYAVLQPNYRGSAGYGSQWFQKNGFQSWRTAIGDVDDAGRWLISEGIAAPTKLAIVGWSYGGYAALQSGVLDPGLFKAVVAIAPVTDLDTWRRQFTNYANFTIMDSVIGHGAHITEGSPARNADRITAPVLLFHGDLDTNVGIGESRLMADKLRDAGKKVELVEFKGLDHQLADDKARASILAKSDAFLRSAMGL